MTPGRIIQAVAALTLLVALGACAPAIEEQVGECEPGVDSLSQTMSAIPATPC